MTEKRVLSTWIVLDSDENASMYPQAGRLKSNNPKIHSLYWRCVACFFAVAKRVVGDDITLRLYTNSSDNISKVQPEVGEILAECGVEIAEVPLEHLPPAGYYGRWRNQFYILDILASIAKGDEQGAGYLILDSDCLCLRPLDEVFQLIQEKGALTMLTGESIDADINGLTRAQMKSVFEEIGKIQLSEMPAYSGGELFAANVQTIRKMLPIAEDAWHASLARHENGQLKLNEEAHLLSYVYCMMGIENGTAQNVIKRLWTGVHYMNGKPEDSFLPIVHLPSEKRFGFVNLYKQIQNKKSWFYSNEDSNIWRRRVQKMMSVPRPSVWKMAYEVCTYALARLSS